MASAAGSPVGDIVLSATGIGSAIGVTFGGVAGTIAAVIDANHIATTAPACTGLTVPSCTASNGAATNVAISVSMPSGPPITTTGTGLSLFRYVAQGFDFYVSAQTNVIGDAGAGVVGTLTDHSGNGYDAIPVTPPPWVATGGGTAGDFPYVQFPDRVTDWRIYNSAYPAQIGGIGGWFTAVRATDVSALDIATLGFSASNLQLTQYSGASSQISIYNGSFVGPISASSVGVDFFVESDFNGSGSSGISVNGGSVTTGSAGTASSTIGYIIGGDGLLVGYGWIGFWYQTLHYPAPLTGAAKDNVNAAFAAVFP